MRGRFPLILWFWVYWRVVTLATQLPSRLCEASKLYCFPQIFQSSLVDTSLGLAFQQKKVSLWWYSKPREVNGSITSTDLAAPRRRLPDGSRRPALKHGGFTTNFATSGSIWINCLEIEKEPPRWYQVWLWVIMCHSIFSFLEATETKLNKKHLQTGRSFVRNDPSM